MGQPTRTCLACRRAADKPLLVRLAVVGDILAVDHLARNPGRGAYLCPSADCLQRALRRDGQALRRALRLEGGAVDAEALQAEFAVSLAEKQQPGDKQQQGQQDGAAHARRPRGV